MKIFISQKMNGLTEKEILEERRKVVEFLKQKYGEFEPIGYITETPPKNAGPLWYLAKSIEQLAEADAAYFCAGWGSARGCRIEREICTQYGIKVLNEINFY